MHTIDIIIPILGTIGNLANESGLKFEFTCIDIQSVWTRSIEINSKFNVTMINNTCVSQVEINSHLNPIRFITLHKFDSH